MVATKFAGRKNPFTGQQLKPARVIDPATLAIADDQPVVARASAVSKYDALFRELKPGQCVVCEPDEAGKINAALRKWLNAQGLSHVKTKATSRYPKDGRGRVWRLA